MASDAGSDKNSQPQSDFRAHDAELDADAPLRENHVLVPAGEQLGVLSPPHPLGGDYQERLHSVVTPERASRHGGSAARDVLRAL